MHYHSRKYDRLITFIALNDNPGDHEDVEQVAGYMTVVMIADCYDLKPLHVAEDVLCIRNRKERAA